MGIEFEDTSVPWGSCISASFLRVGFCSSLLGLSGTIMLILTWRNAGMGQSWLLSPKSAAQVSKIITVHFIHALVHTWSWLSLLISLHGDNKMSRSAKARSPLGVTLKQCHYCVVESRVQKLLISHLVLFQFGIVVESVRDVCGCVTWPASKRETEILAECTVDFQISCLIPQSQV